MIDNTAAGDVATPTCRITAECAVADGQGSVIANSAAAAVTCRITAEYAVINRDAVVNTVNAPAMNVCSVTRETTVDDANRTIAIIETPPPVTPLKLPLSVLPTIAT